MALVVYILCVLAILVLFCFFNHTKKWNRRPWSIWPLIPANFHRLHDWLAEILEANHGTVLIKRPPLLFGSDVLLTSDPANVQHIMSTNFSNYPKGSPWKQRFDIFGESIFNSDYDEWTYHRKVFRGYYSHRQFKELAAKSLHKCIHTDLIPVLDSFTEQHVAVDMQALFKRLLSCFAFYICTGSKPSSFNVESLEDPYSKAMDDAFEAILVRHLMPEGLAKFQRQLRIGTEKTLMEAWKIVDCVFEEQVQMKKEKLSKVATLNEDEDFTVLAIHMIGGKLAGSRPVTCKVTRDNILGLLMAIQDTTSITLAWFFWVLSKHSSVEAKIRKELQEYLPKGGEGKICQMLVPEQLTKMVYLHAALCETLRLFPPAPIQTRIAAEKDTLPSGHQINQQTEIAISTYAMARMTSVWGQDCNEFKPERWITENGSIRHEPPHKFFSFNAGPRICPGKELGFTLIKTFAAVIIQSYHVEAVQQFPIIATGIFLQMKHGLMVRLKKIGA
ncbi:hypothetical protein K2173_005222 [Erythroxylum novogranatense]|uniref:Cytochrome P450 n=1 Tax=Erythroxylum novogranatense TaxID=1862640 RepID=A0AAV8TUM4_9ROSI|nr:hypothetical protein K2173_005222 [Erythroxylum novogranatense]